MPPLERPHLRGGSAGSSRVVLVMHGGSERNTQPTSGVQLSYLRMVDFYRSLRRASSPGTAVYLVRFRLRGWNADREVPDPVADATWALGEVTRRHPDASVALLGHSMGGRTAFAVAAHPSVVGVCGLAPWLPADEPLPERIGSTGFVIAHGTSDTTTSAPLSLTYAERLRAAGGRVARFEVTGGKHALVDHAGLWRRFAVSTSLGLVGDTRLTAPVSSALDSSTGSVGLSDPLADALTC